MITTTKFLKLLTSIIIFSVAHFNAVLCLEPDSCTIVLKDSDSTVDSPGKQFTLGFFRPDNNTTTSNSSRYLGIWHSFSPSSITWVANQARPINDSFGSLTISSDGNLVLRDGKKDVIWSSNVVLSSSPRKVTAQLLDSGKLILADSCSNGGVLWESHRIPGNSIMPTVRLKKKMDRRLVVVVSVMAVWIAASICLFFYRWNCKQKAHGKSETSRWNLSEFSIDEVDIKELPLYTFDMLAIATSSFGVGNKLGMGGFGPVYKGKLENGEEIAVKRLSAASGQGLEEFMNEVVVISKLQHRNLVRLLGCCVEREEKMLIYEYMHNKSLDVFLFDTSENVLDWRKRFDIIEGIGRGLLYLHRDSRLRIIHRDLKPSNILLDEDWNPKISDFGMARIFGGNQDQANTGRVMGTYGYMAPEYAMGGTFSEKSDVFSFGVLVLEIISGRRNTSFYNDESSLSLLGYAWKLWNEENPLDLIDVRITSSSQEFHAGMKRCMRIGLLCVQEFPENRPSISTVVSMLSNEIVDLPVPEHPRFTDRWIRSPERHYRNDSDNKITITVMDGR